MRGYRLGEEDMLGGGGGLRVGRGVTYRVRRTYWEEVWVTSRVWGYIQGEEDILGGGRGGYG